MADEIVNSTQNEDKSHPDLKAKEEISLPEDFKTILTDPEIPNHKKEKIIKALIGVTIREASSFSGPIPPPEILRGYNEIVSNGAERIMAMAEKQSNHRMQLEDLVIREELRQSRVGQIFGFILGIVGLGLATLLAILGHEVIAGIFGTTIILGLVTVFVLGKKAQNKDLENKD